MIAFPHNFLWRFRNFSTFILFSAFFDDFERQTQGENFSSQPNKESSEFPPIPTEKSYDREGTAQDETLTDFFDEFEKTTGGEDFRKRTE